MLFLYQLLIFFIPLYSTKHLNRRIHSSNLVKTYVYEGNYNYGKIQNCFTTLD